MARQERPGKAQMVARQERRERRRQERSLARTTAVKARTTAPARVQSSGLSLRMHDGANRPQRHADCGVHEAARRTLLPLAGRCGMRLRGGSVHRGCGSGFVLHRQLHSNVPLARHRRDVVSVASSVRERSDDLMRDGQSSSRIIAPHTSPVLSREGQGATLLGTAC